MALSPKRHADQLTIEAHGNTDAHAWMIETDDPTPGLVVATDAATSGIIRALRVLSMPPAFTTALSLAIRDQAAQPFEARQYDAALADLYRRYPRTENLVARAQSRFLSAPGRHP